MKRNRIIGFVLTLLLSGIAPAVSAQFQGHIVMNVYEDSDKGADINVINMYVTKNRIFFKGGDKMSFSGGIGVEPSGLLVRNDEKDFVLIMEQNEALQITKTEIESFMSMLSMMDNMNGNNKKEEKAPAPKVRYSDKTKNINGFPATEMVLEYTDGKNRGDYISIWLTPGIDINWGMLSEPWKNLPQDMEATVNGTMRQNLFTGSNFPVLVEAFDAQKGKTAKIMEVTEIEKDAVSGSQVEVPSGMKLLGLNDLMMKMMSNR